MNLEAVDVVVRGILQLLQFMVLGMCIRRLLDYYDIMRSRTLTAAAIVMGASAFNELFQQLFAAGRYFDVSDLILGCVGGALGVSITVILTNMLVRRHEV